MSTPNTSILEQPNELTTIRKALLINLDPRFYGTFAEIGAGQEVARCFFQAGGAAGTIAKSVSAYDMQVSDSIYGKSTRYVCKDRLIKMLDYEYQAVENLLGSKRGAETCFFAFANTVAAKSYKGTDECHGWMGVRFQKTPKGPVNNILMHVRMLDKTNQNQQTALGIAGVNLLYACFYYNEAIDQFLGSLEDNVGSIRIEIDMLSFAGTDLEAYDNRMISLKLVQKGFTHAALLAPNGAVLHPSDTLYKKNILLERGSFFPITKLNVDMIECAEAQFTQELKLAGQKPFIIFEITIKQLTELNQSLEDLLTRAETLMALGYNVLISDYYEYYRLIAYLKLYTREMIGITVGINLLLEIFNNVYYEHLDGGILEACGRLFKEGVKLYIYPMQVSAYKRYVLLEKDKPSVLDSSHIEPESLLTADTLQFKEQLQGLYRYLFDSKLIVPITGFNPAYLGIFSKDVLLSIQSSGSEWEQQVPSLLVPIIKEKRLWQWRQ